MPIGTSERLPDGDQHQSQSEGGKSDGCRSYNESNPRAINRIAPTPELAEGLPCEPEDCSIPEDDKTGNGENLSERLHLPILRDPDDERPNGTSGRLLPPSPRQCD